VSEHESAPSGEPEARSGIDLATLEYRPPPRWAPLALMSWITLVVMGYWATIVSPDWADSRPLDLMALHSRVRHLVAASARDVDPLMYTVIGTIRLSLSFWVTYLVGRAFGRKVLLWFGKYLGSSREQIHNLLAGFHKAEWVIVPFFVGSNLVAAITGIARTPLRRLIPLVYLGIAGRLLLWWVIGRVAEDEVDSVLDFVGRYQRPALIVTAVLVVGAITFNVRRGRDFEL
jgi:membrane protein DedA with SNARE-associated domain